MAAVVLEPEPVPLTEDDAGRLMVVGTRVPLETLVAAFKRGASPEAIHESYDTVPLADVYLVLAYYLRHKTEVETYIRRQERKGNQTQARIEAEDPPDGLRAKLLAQVAGPGGPKIVITQASEAAHKA